MCLRHLTAAIVVRFTVFLSDKKEIEFMELIGEMTHWQYHWESRSENVEEIPTKALNALQAFDRNTYPWIPSLLQIPCILPVSNVSSERSSVQRFKGCQ